MITYLGWIVAGAVALAWWLVGRRAARECRQLAALLDSLAEGRAPGSFVFRHGGPCAELTHPLERLAREHENLRSAWQWARSGPGGRAGGLKLAAGMTRFWHVRSL